MQYPSLQKSMCVCGEATSLKLLRSQFQSLLQQTQISYRKRHILLTYFFLMISYEQRDTPIFLKSICVSCWSYGWCCFISDCLNLMSPVTDQASVHKWAPTSCTGLPSAVHTAPPRPPQGRASAEATGDTGSNPCRDRLPSIQNS